MDTILDIVRLNLLPIIIALLIGLVVGWWIFARRRSAVSRQQTPPVIATPPPPRDLAGVAEVGAAGVADVGEPIEAEAPTELPLASGPPDDLQTLKGVGPKLAAMLNEQGITRFEQLAALTAQQVERIDVQLGAFRGRLARDRVVEQAGYLARGDLDGFQAKFGNLGCGAGG